MRKLFSGALFSAFPRSTHQKTKTFNRKKSNEKTASQPFSETPFLLRIFAKRLTGTLKTQPVAFSRTPLSGFRQRQIQDPTRFCRVCFSCALSLRACNFPFSFVISFSAQSFSLLFSGRRRAFGLQPFSEPAFERWLVFVRRSWELSASGQ